MGPEAWKRKIGEEAWIHVVGEYSSGPQQSAEEAVVADVLTRACEAGFRPPGLQPKVDPAGTKVLWPTPQGDRPVLTAAGLLNYYKRKGHGFVIFRMEQLMRAVAGPLLPRLQEVFAAYEEQCAEEGTPPVPLDWRGFVGGEQPDAAWITRDAAFLRNLAVMCSEPDRSGVDRVHIANKR